MVLAEVPVPSLDGAGPTADQEDQRESADDEDAHCLGQLVLLGVVFKDLLDGFNGLTGRILEDVPDGAHGSVGLDGGKLQQMSQQRKHVNSIDLGLGVFWSLEYIY